MVKFFLLTSCVIFNRCSIKQNKRLLYIGIYNMGVRIVLIAGITNVASSIGTPLRRGVLDTKLCDKVCQWLATGRWFFPGTPLSSTNKNDRHDITEILLKVELNTINLYWRPVLEETRGTRQYLPICYATINLLDHWNNKKKKFQTFFYMWTIALFLQFPMTPPVILTGPAF